MNPDPPTLDDILAGDAIAWTIFPPDAGIVGLMDREPGWRRLYADSVAVIHVRSDALLIDRVRSTDAHARSGRRSRVIRSASSRRHLAMRA